MTRTRINTLQSGPVDDRDPSFDRRDHRGTLAQVFRDGVDVVDTVPITTGESERGGL
nr:hypothetical protein [Methanoculleus marisnigri]